ncbi:TetR/AcrR family transcriptional regulator [Mycobacterium avium subsp. hominissuis]|jgi:AcrR family transcriptional regulator|uniref:TetR family transcriptional regulator n=3 Tax=Mycobacterium TaxID=1763 RepID=A0AAW5S3V0_MYCBC|nr:TetR family transcriptional regulator [Mycobacterium avium 05-4293]ETB36677.1 TetR family transcriptional regulator [Mycobacterium avium subsp. hominissuis 10-5606]MBG0727977.1 TetR/AcrR family transcriptional regulator [Mycobacterium avium]MBZ4502225.1 TetR/AcrR family transcriptional regulator [Mycobacterium avium subsp. hominissuis]MCV6990115.1 TetR/AcrR family transcriptional regulator [Mycobacterium bouchedurhonense]MCV6997153.1 TetR/AcrR family transcriptional regulator [Mycobacterium
MARIPDKLRRPGYAPVANAGVGRRGLHTRERILACAAEVFLADGYHATSLDAIAKAANASRATVYQYFAGKEEIFRELSALAEHDVLEHGEHLGGLGPTVDGVHALHRWLVEWADIYDAHAAVFAEFPGIGTPSGLSVIDASTAANQFHKEVTDRLRSVRLRGLDADDAAAVLGRIPHMVHLYRYRAMFPLPAGASVTWSLTIALQLMLFPETPADALQAAAPRTTGARAVIRPRTLGGAAVTAAAIEESVSPIARDVLSVSSALFAERGYYAVGMEEIAAAADISRATLYRYFSTKDKILADLTRRAVVEIEEHAAALPALAAGSLIEWMRGYVRFHRTYRGVIRAWFDGTVAEQLSDADVDHGIGAIFQAVSALVSTVDLPAGIDVDVAAAVFVAVLGRMSEPTGASASDSEERAAELMVKLLRRSLLREA